MDWYQVALAEGERHDQTSGHTSVLHDFMVISTHTFTLV